MSTFRGKITSLFIGVSGLLLSAGGAIASCATFSGSSVGFVNIPAVVLNAGDVVTFQITNIVNANAYAGAKDDTVDPINNAFIQFVGGTNANAGPVTLTFTIPANRDGHSFSFFGSYNLYNFFGPGASATFNWSCTPAPVPTPPSASTSNLITSQLSGQRMQAILGGQLGGDRQFDRLVDQNIGNGGTPGTGFTSEEKLVLDASTSVTNAPRLGLGTGNREGLANLGRPVDDDEGPGRLGGPAASSRANAGTYSAGGMRFFGSSEGMAQYNFSASLRDVTRAAAQQEQQRLANDPTAAAMGFRGIAARGVDTRANPFDVWVEGRFTSLNDGRNNADLHGHTGLFGVGADYVLNRTLLAGVFLQYDSVSQKSSTQSTQAKGTGWLAGPYATVRLGENVFWQSRLGWGRADNDLSPNLTVTDSVGSTRWMGSSRVVGRFQNGPWTLRPSASIAYMEENFEGYTSGTGAAVSDIKTRLGIATAGPEISYQMRLSPGVLIEPRAGFDTLWTFARDASVGGNSATIAGDAIGPSGVRGRATLGLRTLIVGGTVLDLSGTCDGIGVSDYNNVTGRATVRLPLN